MGSVSIYIARGQNAIAVVMGRVTMSSFLDVLAVWGVSWAV